MHRIQCKCGNVRGHIDSKGTSNRLICYCTDCQAFAMFIGRSIDVLDAQGGTETVQLAQPRLHFTKGKEHLAAVRLSEKGLIRWYTACCNTPIGNTPANAKLSFIGLVHSPLDHSQLDADFGRELAVVNVSSAVGEPKPKQRGLPRSITRMFRIALSMRVSGGYRKSELFDTSGNPVVRPVVLTAQQREALKLAL